MAIPIDDPALAATVVHPQFAPRLEALLKVACWDRCNSGVSALMKSTARRIIQQIRMDHRGCWRRGVRLVAESTGLLDLRRHEQLLGRLCPAMGACAALGNRVFRAGDTRPVSPDVLQNLISSGIVHAIRGEGIRQFASEHYGLHPAFGLIARLYWTHAVIALAIAELDFWREYWAGKSGINKVRFGPLLHITAQTPGSVQLYLGLQGGSDPFGPISHDVEGGGARL